MSELAKVPEPTAKPIFRWAGSKRKQVKELARYYRRDYERYVEPFVGSACFFLHLNPPSALLADKNQELIETYRTISLFPNEVFEQVNSLKRCAGEYYRLRALDLNEITPMERAVRFLYLNRNCFNGIYRTNRQGHFNVPFASNRAGRYPTSEEFGLAVSRFKRAKFRNWDFGLTLRNVGEGDFVYLDPPYVVASRRVFREYGESPFTMKDLERLKKHLHRIHKRGAHFLFSYADCKESREIGMDWQVRRLRVRRFVSGFVDGRRRSYELLISNVGIEG